MKIMNLKLLNFRNYDNLNLEFSDSNIIYGKNGMGKTNIVEAIYVLALTKTFRSNNDKILIKDNSDLTKISGTIEDDINKNYQIIINNKGKRVKIDNNFIKKISDYISRINVILFNPNDLQIIKDSPSIRRRLLNVSISELDNIYLKKLSNYNKIIKQRNAYLKTLYVNANQSRQYLDVITDNLIDLGYEIYEFRKEYIKSINLLISDIYYKISGLNDISIEYISDYKDLDKEKIRKKYKDYQEKDMLFGVTKFGVHRDDLVFKLNGKDLKDYGSEGQQKNAIIAYKLSEIFIFKEKKNKNPIFILDDLFSELDEEKINNIMNLLDESVQTFITTTEIDKISDNIKNKSKIFHITEDGVIGG